MKPSVADRIRFVCLMGFLFSLFCAVGARFYQIQIVEGEKWKEAALAQHQVVWTDPAMRGTIYANSSVKGRHLDEEVVLACDVPKFHLFIDPDAISSPFKDPIAEKLFEFLEISPQEKGKLRSQFDRKSRSRKVAMWLDRSMKERIENWWRGFAKKSKIPQNALFFSFEYQRSHPFGTMLGTVLQTVRNEKDPLTQQRIPTGGLEALFDSYLQGKEGKRKLTRSLHHPLGTGEILCPVEDGADLFLTINHYLQAITEEELAKGVKAVSAKGGWAVMMDPKTGEILSFAQTPSFDPRSYGIYYQNPDLLDRTRIFPLAECFEPGSIFKPLIAAICLQASQELLQKKERPLFSPSEKISTSSGAFPGRTHPIKDGRKHNYLNLDMAMQKSSNIYPGKIVQRLIERFGDRWMRQALVSTFGFGEKTNVELPAENPGLVPTPGKLHPNGTLEWSVSTPYSLAIGHNILVNSVQIVRAFSILANRGLSVEPHLIRKIVKKGEALPIRTNPPPQKRVLDQTVAERVIRSMKYVTKLGGSGTRADVMGYTEAGKSGTAEKIINGSYSKEKNISSFVGFCPVNNPRFVLLVSIDEPESKFIPGVGKQQHGGVCAAPIFREIAFRSLQYLGVEPDDPYGYPYGDPRRNPSLADWNQEVQELKSLYQAWNGS